MELTPKQQITELVRGSSHILITTHQQPDGDAIGSLLALSLALQKLGKTITAVSPDSIPPALSFLPAVHTLNQDIPKPADFIISIDTSTVPIEKLSYRQDHETNKLNILVTPKQGQITERLISFTQIRPKFDLIFVLDSPGLLRLGPVYEKHSDVFYEAPVVNIDHHPGNDSFGKVNWVELTATSTAEILVALLEALGRDTSLLDQDIATALLTGLITDTGSFQNANTTPKSLTVAAQLVAAGARQQEIIQHIFKTKPLSTLKLWGRILANIAEEKDARFAYSTATKEDFGHAGAKDEESSGVIDELLKSAPGVDFVLLLVERGGGIHGSLRSTRSGVNVAKIAQLFDGGGHEMAAAFEVPNVLLLTHKNEIIEKIKRALSDHGALAGSELA